MLLVLQIHNPTDALQAGAQGENLQWLLSNDGDTFTAVQSMEWCNYADAMEVQRGADAITTCGLVILVWWFMPLRGKVPRDSWWWCGFVRIKWGALAAVRCRDNGFKQ